MLLAAILGLLLLVNQHYLFHAELYESGDPAANTLAVLRAQHAEELHGPYSRWNFHHPGPALFYGEALGEMAFYRAWHLTPTPYNAQVLAVTLLLTGVFAAGISVAARWVRGGVFVSLALTLAALHFSAVGGRFLFVSTWSAYVIPLVFFGLLTAAASVAAGQGEDLPLLALCGCFLLHLHVAQPLFVAPMFLLAYVGLLWSCRRRDLVRVTAAPATTVSLVKETDFPAVLPTPVKASVLPWRVYRVAHVLAVGIAVAFAAPILVDALFPHGNFRQILAFLRTHPDGGHSWLASLTYFLHFASYQPSEPGADFFAGTATPADLSGFITRHPEMTFLWLGALLSPLLPLAARAWRGKDPVLLGSAAATPADSTAPTGRWRFLGWLWTLWLLSVGLTLLWGHLQQGKMFYFNAWFNYSIWYVLALLAAGSIADALDTLTSRSERPLLWKGLVVALCAVGTFLTISQHADRFRADDADDEPHRAQQQTVARQLATEPAGTPHAKLLLFPHDAWESVTGVAALLARRGDPVYVLPDWANLFGTRDVLPGWENVFNHPADTNPDFEVWHFVPVSQLGEVPSTGPLFLKDYALVPGGLPIDPAKAPAITWTGGSPNFRAYCAKGWNTFESNTDFTKTVEHNAVLQFRAVPIPSTADVRITFDFKPYLPAGKRDSQRMTVHYNGHDLGTFQVNGTEATPPQVAVPAAVWNRYASGLLTLQFPDAISPQAAGEGDDPRLLGFEAHQISFGLLLRVEAPAPAPAESSPPSLNPAETPTPTPGSMPAVTPEPAAIPHASPDPSPGPTPEASPTPESTPVMQTPAETPVASPAEPEGSPGPTPDGP